MIILGISAYYHDSAIAIIKNGEILFAAQEERFSRKKNDPSFPILAIKEGLKYTGFELSEIKCIAFYDKPFLKFERILENQLNTIPFGLIPFCKNIPSWINEKLFTQRSFKKSFKAHNLELAKDCKFTFPEHHLSHAASAFYPSPFKSSAILTVDGVGEFVTTGLYYGDGNSITKLKEIHYPNSLGLLYSAFTYFLGFKVNSGEYKMMGLAPYGRLEEQQTQTFIAQIKDKIITIKKDGSYALNLRYFSFTKGRKMINEKKWVRLFGIKRRTEDFTQEHANLALAIQKVTEEAVLGLALTIKNLTNSPNLCLAGGVALNSVINGILAESPLFDEIFIQPAAGDAGGALGAALATHHIYYENERNVVDNYMQNGLLGNEPDQDEVALLIQGHKGDSTTYKDENELIQDIAKYIAQDKIIGWVQGRMEFGPRALGARSILANPLSNETQRRVNLQTKQRESFRPFAPIMLEEELEDIVPGCKKSEYMLQVHQIADKHKLITDDNYSKLDWRKKLATQKSTFPAITHVDFSARVQSVGKENKQRVRKLLEEVKNISGYGILVNTSFNSNEEPMVCSAKDAYQCFIKSKIDVLVIDKTVFLANPESKSSNSTPK